MIKQKIYKQEKHSIGDCDGKVVKLKRIFLEEKKKKNQIKNQEKRNNTKNGQSFICCKCLGEKDKLAGKGCALLCNKKIPRLPGGATIRCHFWKSVVLRQSRGLSEYALCLDISSCIGSRITQS